ncbi:uncharacterized protein MELLADRAFT_50057 [Melampsora larici-populina 98AG31]|uniref:Fatty acid hydroxylase domain-containing protein n=1 Tax=Melampsora larici-populina (strain 98AG31 / pathotype 3-4-7) TaxID=747676 RepID=F4S1F9_MELLP|nr:uncharacterized protein MELLADRAFT_50057 [Melampsora larici-populina 98AG31]EGG01568.1 hypothetical protein MELLADRAFT_50057 [Melampsora larici-populina 98AG31]
MDIILNKADEIFLDYLWSKAFPINSSNHQSFQNINQTNLTRNHLSTFNRQNLFRQSISISSLALISVPILYLSLGLISFYFLFDHRLMNHPRFLKNQIQLEIYASLRAIGPMIILTLPIFLAEVRGYSLLYDNVNDFRGLPISALINWIYQMGLNLFNFINHQHHQINHTPNWLNSLIQADFHLGGGWTYLIFSQLFFLWFTDLAIYLVHRWIHTPSIYKYIHKAHHKWIIPTPFASYAFNPLDGFLQSLPYHLFIFIFPLHKSVYLSLFVFVNLWSILIHDSDLIVGHPLEHIINGPSHHTLHHLHFTCNYGQYFTWADRLGKTYRHPIQADQLELIASSEKKSIERKLIKTSSKSTFTSNSDLGLVKKEIRDRPDRFEEQILSCSSDSTSGTDEGLMDHEDLVSIPSSDSLNLLSSPSSDQTHQSCQDHEVEKNLEGRNGLID